MFYIRGKDYGSYTKHLKSSKVFSSMVTDMKPSVIQQASLKMFVSIVMMANIYLASTVNWAI